MVWLLPDRAHAGLNLPSNNFTQYDLLIFAYLTQHIKLTIQLKFWLIFKYGIVSQIFKTLLRGYVIGYIIVFGC